MTIAENDLYYVLGLPPVGELDSFPFSYVLPGQSR